jgi:serine/threonine-protein kinase
LAASILVALAVLVLLLSPSTGQILVTAAGPNNAAIASARVVVDDRVVCSTVPCRAGALTRGSHLVRVQAPGYERTADQAVSVQSGEESVIHFKLAGENSAGIDVRVAAAPELRITLDGIDRGPAPLVLRGLSAGQHTLRLDGSPLYAPFEQQLQLDPAQILLIEPKLVPLKAVINVTPGIAALGAWVEIEGGGVRHELRKLPARVEVAPDASYRLRAKRIGYRDYETEISFADGVLEKVIPIDLAWDAAIGANGPLSTDAMPVVLESSETGTLGANSIPISSVFIDGRPVGTTPVQIPVAPGRHHVVFVHPSMGRKSVTVEVTAAKPTVAAVRF